MDYRFVCPGPGRVEMRHAECFHAILEFANHEVRVRVVSQPAVDDLLAGHYRHYVLGPALVVDLIADLLESGEAEALTDLAAGRAVIDFHDGQVGLSYHPADL